MALGGLGVSGFWWFGGFRGLGFWWLFGGFRGFRVLVVWVVQGFSLGFRALGFWWLWGLGV